MKRIAVIGCGGSGKTIIARRLATVLDLPLTHLDSVYYNQEWNPLPQNEFAVIQEKLVAGERWLIEGNYANTFADPPCPRTDRTTCTPRQIGRSVQPQGRQPFC